MRIVWLLLMHSMVLQAKNDERSNDGNAPENIPKIRRGRESRGREQWHLGTGQHNVVILGPPGVGKGSQSERIVRRYGVCHISTGDLLRAEVKRGSPLGNLVKATMSKGKLVPDKLMIRMVRKYLNRDDRCQKNGWLLDGFPRTATQAIAMLSAGLIPHHIVVLNASVTTLVSRALGRAADARRRGASPRSDDNAQTMQKRVAEYEHNKNATLKVFSTFMHIVSVDGEPAPVVVARAIHNAMRLNEA